MGSWDETCALSHIGILENDPVVRVRVRIDRLFNNECPTWSDIFQWSSPSDYFCVHDIMDGKYSSYGDLKGHDREEGVDDWENYFSFFFHEKAWAMAQTMSYADIFLTMHNEEEALNEYIQRLPRLTREQVPRIMEFIRVTRLAYAIRTPICIPPSGPQSAGDSDAERRKMIKLQIELLDDLKKKYDDDE